MRPVRQTLEFTVQVPAPARWVWDMFADHHAWVRWGTPDGEAQVFDAAEFRPGGRDRYRCGAPHSLDIDGVSDYLVIDPERLIVHSDLVARDGVPLAAALLTWRFLPADRGTATTVHLTDQVTSFVGPTMIDGHRNGHTLALRQLHTWAQSPRDRLSGS